MSETLLSVTNVSAGYGLVSVLHNVSISVLPGAADAQMWEPEPSVVYAWEKAAVA